MNTARKSFKSSSLGSPLGDHKLGFEDQHPNNGFGGLGAEALEDQRLEANCLRRHRKFRTTEERAARQPKKEYADFVCIELDRS